ncbi:hypothetical protein GF402_09040 [Candidatus Fermentibacteria bacterium]|nr:hypothetical protein [Candidatus Fermentibacteria bacterium]
MKRISMFVLLLSAIPVLAGPQLGGRFGYYDGNEPRTGGEASNPSFGGQFVMPMLGLVDVEVSASYTSTESDITMEDYLFNYIEEEEGVDLGGDLDSLLGYLEDEWGWEDPTQGQLIEDYTAKFHDLDLGLTLKLNVPVGTVPLQPYIGGGGGAHFIVSDADLLIQFVNQQTGGEIDIDPYDHVHPGVHGVLGAKFQPAKMPISIFAEYKIAQALGDEAGSGGINSYTLGVNLGF